MHSSFCSSLVFNLPIIPGMLQKAVSSAKHPFLINYWNLILKSLVNGMYKMGEREDPWGSPWICSFQKDEPSLVTTLVYLCVMSSIMHFKKLPLILYM